MSTRDYTGLAAGRVVRLPSRRQYQRRDAQIASATAGLRTRRMSMLDFLRLGARFFDPVTNVDHEQQQIDLGDETEVGYDVNWSTF